MIDLFCVGLGYSATVFARQLRDAGTVVGGTTRSAARAAELSAAGFPAVVFDGETASPAVTKALATATHLVVSAAPDAAGDPLLRCHHGDIATAPHLRWIAYLSTVGVYGDWQGAEVDETSVPRPIAERGRRRLEAEAAWLELGRTLDKACRCSGSPASTGRGRTRSKTYGAATPRRIIKPGQVFNRIHVDDIALTLEARWHSRATAPSTMLPTTSRRRRSTSSVLPPPARRARTAGSRLCRRRHDADGAQLL